MPSAVNTRVTAWIMTSSSSSAPDAAKMTLPPARCSTVSLPLAGKALDAQRDG